MRALLQRVDSARVDIEGLTPAVIEKGLLVLLGIHATDTSRDRDYIIRKILQARLFGDEDGKMSLSVADIGGDLLIVSQVTLYAEMKKGNRPDLSSNMKPDQAGPFFQDFVDEMKRQMPLKVQQGQFAAMMKIGLVNNGPITVLLDSDHLKGR